MLTERAALACAVARIATDRLLLRAELAELDALAVLGCETDADMIVIKAAWRNAAKVSHPDVAGTAPEAVARFRAVQAAWQVLSDADAARTAAGA